jgi:hypothetical protein
MVFWAYQKSKCFINHTIISLKYLITLPVKVYSHKNFKEALYEMHIITVNILKHIDICVCMPLAKRKKAFFQYWI